MATLFTYGSLSLPEVMKTLTGRDFESSAADAEDFERFLLRGKPYPALVRRDGRKTEGRIYFEVDEDTLDVLDKFEDDCYVREEISVTLKGGEVRSVSAAAYVLPQEQAELLSRERWDEEKFRAVYLDNYLRMCDSFYRKYP